MRRMSHLLRASVESLDTTPEQSSLESYMEYRQIQEEWASLEDIQSQLIDLSENLNHVEEIVEESRQNETLSEDQVDLQLAAVNQARLLIEGDVSKISVESFDSLLAVSLEASDKSGNILKRIWDAFIAMLNKVWEVIQNIGRWITSSNKKAKQECKEGTELANDVKAAATEATPESKETVVEEIGDKVAAATANKEAADKIMDEVLGDTRNEVYRIKTSSAEILKKVNEKVKEEKEVLDILKSINKEDPRDVRDRDWGIEVSHDMERIKGKREELNRILANPPTSYGDIDKLKTKSHDLADLIGRVENDFFKYDGREDKLETLTVDIMRTVADIRAGIKPIEAQIATMKPGNGKRKELEQTVAQLRGDIRWLSESAVTNQRFLQFGHGGRHIMSNTLAKARKGLKAKE